MVFEEKEFQEAFMMALKRNDYTRLNSIRKAVLKKHDNVANLTQLSHILYPLGYLTDLKQCAEYRLKLQPENAAPWIDLGLAAMKSMDHKESQRIFYTLLSSNREKTLFDDALLSLEYNPDVSHEDRLQLARAYGEWAVRNAGFEYPRPPMRSLENRSLNVGFLSNDFYQHTAGLFVKDIFKYNRPEKVRFFAYSSGAIKDVITDEIQGTCIFQSVEKLSNAELAAKMHKDGIDVLVDLSGHTSPNRQELAAFRPAPVMVSWLGYFATTGAPYMDAMLMDEWHIPKEIENQFTEPVVHLPHGRFCYIPVAYMPASLPEPSFAKKGYITFGSFNNTAKYNPYVFDLWAKILKRVENSHLLLKWSTLRDETLRETILKAFEERGISRERIELRIATPHAAMLKEYGDMDIALDPFPFSGGLTSCEALFMGVPVVTWPRDRAVSRQTYAFYNQIGIPELAAQSEEEYLDRAESWARDHDFLLRFRGEIRQKMLASPLMDVESFTHDLEDTLIGLYKKIEAEEKAGEKASRRILHVASGARKTPSNLPPYFQTSSWKEVRLDTDVLARPDILVENLRDLRQIPDESYNALYASHVLERFYPQEIHEALVEFRRILTGEGFLVLVLADLQEVCKKIADDRLLETLYEDAGGAVSPFDLLYGPRKELVLGKISQARHSGFTAKTVLADLGNAYFKAAAYRKYAPASSLWVVASKADWEPGRVEQLASHIVPKV